MNKLSSLLLTFAITNITATAQDTFTTNTLVSDFKHLVHLLETTHPDPYTNYGGKAWFHRKASEIIWSMKKDSVTTTDELCKYANSFLSTLQDGHTFILTNHKNHDEIKRFTPIYFRVINDGLTVRGLPIEYKPLIGSRLIGIESEPINKIYDATATFMTTENIIGKYAKTAYCINQESTLKQIIPNLPADSVKYNLLSPDGEEVTITLPLLSPDITEQTAKAWQPFSQSFPTENLAYAFLDDSKQSMYFRCTSVMARDCIEAMREMGTDFYGNVKYYYKSINKEVPSDTARAIAGIPSFSDTFAQMLTQMKKHKSKNLVIDLRDNGGGWTPIVLPTLYQLYGDEYLKKNMETKFYRILSPLYMKKINMTLEQFNERWNTDYEFGDYTYNEEKDKPETITAEIRDNFVRNCMSSVKQKLFKQKGLPVYTPENIYVITNSNTFSAAFHYAFYLRKMGAKIVGVACQQAPNTYMEQTAFELPKTHLKGSISNSMQIFLPTDDKRAKVFSPDIMITYDDFKKYHFDGQSDILYLKDMLK